MYDYHVHSSFSGDCVEKMEATILEAISKNGKQICFTDHLDYDYPIEEFDFEMNQFELEFNNLSNQYGDRIILQKGIELGLQPHLVNRCNDFVELFKPDFVLCSFHCCEGKDLHNGDYFIGKDPVTAWHNYLDEMIVTLREFTNYSVVGHIDILKRYNIATRKVDFSSIEDKLVELLNVIIKSDRGIEINMSGLRTPLNKTLPSIDVIKLYHTLGGRIITLGSDAHKKEDIYSHYRHVLEMLLEVGFDNITVFDKMKANNLDIKEALENL